MPWHGVLGHDDVVELFRHALRGGRMASSFLFCGPNGIGKRLFAGRLAQSLLCSVRPEELLDPCGQCPSCQQVLAGSHPDLDEVSKPADKSFIPLELLIGDKEHRMREGLCANLSLRPYMGGRKIAIINDADFLNAEGANCLLKTLEEPPPRSVLILIGSNPARQLPTIRSRCQLVRFRPLDSDLVARLLIEQQIVNDPQEAQRLAAYSAGSLQRAAQMADPALWTFRRQLCEQLAHGLCESVALAQTTLQFVEAAGREASARRERLRQIVGMATDFYRALLRRVSGAEPCADAELAAWVEQAIAGRQGHPNALATRIERCLDAAEQIDRNANQSTLVECWIDDLARVG